MAQAQTHSIPRDKFLMMSVNLLYKALLETSRTRAKRIYQQIADGENVHLTTVKMEDQSTVRFDLGMDVGEFHGRINFGAFRRSLSVLIANLSAALKEQKDITVFTAEQDHNVVIFGVTAVTQERDEKPNVMVLGADAGSGQNSVLLRLMYLDSAQFGEESGLVQADESA